MSECVRSFGDPSPRVLSDFVRVARCRIDAIYVRRGNGTCDRASRREWQASPGCRTIRNRIVRPRSPNEEGSVDGETPKKIVRNGERYYTYIERL